ncbi:putative helicase [Candidatus Burkholderia humilis]|nr:putative helicase [Candidatus Burkholderia humilis]
MICNSERVRQPAYLMGARVSAGDAMNEGKLLQADWENFTREELLAEFTRLQAEIARLTALLPATLQAQAKPVRVTRNEPSPAMRNTGAPVLSPEQKVQLFRRLFRGRTDVYPLCWESRNSGKSGYAPACANEWRAENCPRHIALPRGCLDDAMTLLRDNDIACDIRDERCTGEPVAVSFAGTLRDDQQAAVTDLLRHDTGILHAPTAFGKTVTAAAMIARRSVNTLVLVHRRELLDQWRERLQSFLALDARAIGTIGGGKSKATGRIDVAMLQSVAPDGACGKLLRRYGHVIVDECHHVSADSFEAVLKGVNARYHATCLA